jgi:nucleoside-diphosphate-sugar epimerase
MRALITGANGFLGRHVVASLLARGVEVRAMVRPAARLEALGWPRRSRFSRPTCAARANSSAPSKASTCCCIWRPWCLALRRCNLPEQ